MRRIGALALAFLAGAVVTRMPAHSMASERDGPYAALDLFARVLTQIGDSYVDSLAQRDLVYHALDGMDNALDAHSVFLNPDAYRRMREESEGQYVGIGAQTREDPRGLRVLGVVKDGPAARAGILADDLIVSVDGAQLGGMGLDEATERVRGREGTAVTLGVERNGTTRGVAVLRTRVLDPSIETAMLAPGLAYLRILQFRDGTASALTAEVAAMSPPVRGAVLDLRSNPGGRLDEAVATVDLFVRSGRIVSTRARRPGPDEVWSATDDRADWDWPVVVLVNGDSASAAEIVAGALQDLGRAVLVGERTYGKGSVQSVFEYEDGSALKLTIARYYLPSGRAIDDRAGITPDLLVSPPLVPGPRERLRAAIRSSAPPSERAALEALLDELPPDPQARASEMSGPVEQRLPLDAQLRAALEELQRLK